MSAVANMTPIPLIEVSKSICFLYSSCAKEAIFPPLPRFAFQGKRYLFGCFPTFRVKMRQDFYQSFKVACGLQLLFKLAVVPFCLRMSIGSLRSL